jgi:hypothetical protein
VVSADVRQKTLLTDTGETISYKILIVATGALLYLYIQEFITKDAILLQLTVGVPLSSNMFSSQVVMNTCSTDSTLIV